MLGRWFEGSGERASRRARGIIAALQMVVPIAGCAGCGGDDASPPAAGDGGVDPAAKCAARLPAGWSPRWRPPRAPTADACSEEQIRLEYTACESSTATSATCAPFRNDPANASCIACLFSSENDPSYGAIIRVGGS